jgi:purine-nucleoside phosphorylase
MTPIGEAVAFLRERVTRAPHAVLVHGSGLGGLADEIEDPVRIPFGEIPGFPRRTQELAGHAGALVAGRLEGVEVAAMQGRFHLYEGWGPEDVALPVRALAALGAGTMLVTNAAGGIRPGMRAGDLMLTVPGEERFPDMSDPYDEGFRRIAEEVALELRVPVVQGVYAAMLGPSYETPAEVRMLARIGADAVGMSTVPEVLVARALGVRVLGISCITNVAAGLSGQKLSHAEVMEVGAQVRDRLVALVRGVLPRVAGLNLPSEAAS